MRKKHKTKLKTQTREQKPASARELYTRAKVAQIVHEVRAKYDAAQTSEENRKHWSNADRLSPNSANSPTVRQTLRERARFERDNNSYCKGIVATLAGDLIGTGPRLQLMTESEEANRFIERELSFWSDEIDLPGRLILHDQARHIDGEGIGLLTTNRNLRTPVKLDLRLVEAEQMTTPDLRGTDPLAIDGIRFDAWGNPAEYHILPYHPSDVASAIKRYPADAVLHWFMPDRPGQARGIPTLTPALPLFAQLRRYTLAVLVAAEIAAELAAFIQSSIPPGTDDPAADPFEMLEIVRGQITTLPQGWSVSQLNPSQPTTGFGEFCNQILKEIARCLQMPWGLAAGDSSAYNYASGRLDVQTYQRKIKVERARYERIVIDKLFTAWLDEAILIDGYLPIDGLPPYQEWRWRWHWDGFEHVDPNKEANALKTLLELNATTLEAVYAAKGQDWLEALEQLAKEAKELKRLGLTPPAPPSGDPNAANQADPEADPSGVPNAADA